MLATVSRTLTAPAARTAGVLYAENQRTSVLVSECLPRNGKESEEMTWTYWVGIVVVFFIGCFLGECAAKENR